MQSKASDPPKFNLAETIPHSPTSHGFVVPSPESLARHFPQLEILELLGLGGMGAVYKARQPKLDRLVAVKILPSESAGDPNFAERFAREAKALARLSHPHIVAIYDFGDTTAGLFYFVMEFVDGVNLRQMMRAGELSPREALAIIPQICEALQYAHDEGFVHRDIKPENILVDKRGRVKIADFGLAKLLGRAQADFTLTDTQQVMGTPQYMAPEQIEAPQQVDHRADIYSLGVVFYEMLTRELPIGRFEPPSHRVQVDERLDEVVLKTLEKRPERRYQHASDVKTSVEEIACSPSRCAAAVEPSAISASQAEIQRRVSIPAIGLIIAGAIDYLTAFATSGGAASPGYDEVLRDVAIGALVLLGALRIAAGVRMLRLQSRGFGVAASIVSLLPIPFSAVVGIPAAIWALIVLGRPEVKDAFQRNMP